MKKIYIYLLIAGYIPLIALLIGVIYHYQHKPVDMEQAKETAKPQDEDMDLDAIPWADLLNAKSPADFGDFMEKHKFFEHHIVEGDILSYILYQCNENGPKGELYWKIFNHIGDNCLDACITEAYSAVCWEQCAYRPLFFYERYCKGDKKAINRYYDACIDADDLSYMNYICGRIRKAKNIQKSAAQREKVASTIEKWIKEIERNPY